MAAEAPRILVVDDDPSLQRVLRAALEAEGFGVEVAASAAEADPVVERGWPQAIVLDLNLPGRSGLDCLAAWRAAGLAVPVLVLTAQNTADNAIRAMQLGAFDYITKPFDLDDLYALLRRAVESAVTDAGAEAVKPTSGEPGRAALVGTSAGMQEVYKIIGKTAASDATTLLQGESGTGKELVARAIHEFSPRAHGPFVAVNMTAIPGDLLEAELFGYEKGAFTGAAQASPGKFREAHGGTLLLDEIGDMPLALQGKLLRVLQEREITPLGGHKPIPVDVRVVAATQVPLEAAVKSGMFRADLYYRLKVVEIRLPPLRERPEDVAPLCQLFLQQMAARGEIPPKRVTADALAMLKTLSWPGNVRELQNLVRRVALLSPRRDLDLEAFREFGGERGGHHTNEAQGFARIVEQHLSDYVLSMHNAGASDIWNDVLGTVEAVLLKLALTAVHGNQLKAADLLGINRNTLRKKLTDHRIDPRGFKKSAE